MRSSSVSLRKQLLFSLSFPWRALLCLYHRSFHRVQSPRNMAPVLLANSRTAVSISFCTVCSTTRSPRVSLGSENVTMRSAVQIFSSVVWLRSGGVISSIGDCLRGISLAGIVLSTAVVNASRSDRSLYYRLKRSITSPYFLLQSSNSLFHMPLFSLILSKVLVIRSNSFFTSFRFCIVSFVFSSSSTLVRFRVTVVNYTRLPRFSFLDAYFSILEASQEA